MGGPGYMQAETPSLRRDSLSPTSSLPENACFTPPTGYDTYNSSVASYPDYKYSVPPYESSIPTPVSVAGSPLLSEGTPKMMQQFRGSQQPTPPGTTRTPHAEWYPSQQQAVNGLSSNQPRSPIHVAPPHSEAITMHGLPASHSPDHHQPMASAPPFDYGDYGVSGNQAPQDMSPPMTHQPLYASTMPGIPPSDLVRPRMPMGEPLHPNMLPSQDHHFYAPISQAHGPHMAHLPNSNTPIIMDFQTLPNQRQPKKRSRQRTNQPNKKVKASQDDTPGSPQRDVEGLGIDNTPFEPITLAPEAPPQDHYLFELRNGRREEKGKSMWKDIGRDFSCAYGEKKTAALQMQLNRAILSYAQWPESENEALRKALDDEDAGFYNRILKGMKKHGGGRAWEWKECHVAKQLAQLGLIQLDSENPVRRIRRQQRQAPRSRARGVRGNGMWDDADEQDPTNLHHHHHISNRGMYHNDMTNETDDAIFQHLYKPEPEGSPDAQQTGDDAVADCDEDNIIKSEMLDGSEGGPSLHHPHQHNLNPSQRVAQKACEEFITRNDHQIYGSFLATGDNSHTIS